MDMKVICFYSTDLILLGLIHPLFSVFIFAVELFIFVVAVIATVVIIVIILFIHMDSHLPISMYFQLSHLSIMDKTYIFVTILKMLQDLLSKENTISRGKNGKIAE